MVIYTLAYICCVQTVGSLSLRKSLNAILQPNRPAIYRPNINYSSQFYWKGIWRAFLQQSHWQCVLVHSQLTTWPKIGHRVSHEEKWFNVQLRFFSSGIWDEYWLNLRHKLCQFICGNLLRNFVFNVEKNVYYSIVRWYRYIDFLPFCLFNGSVNELHDFLGILNSCNTHLSFRIQPWKGQFSRHVGH